MKCFHSKLQHVDESVTSIKELDSPGGEGCLPPLCPTAWSLCPDGRCHVKIVPGAKIVPAYVISC